MIIDAHTHVFPPELIARRGELLHSEPAFREVYPDPNAKLASADDVLALVEGSELDAAVICNFAWTDLDRIRETNDYVLDAARRSDGRLISVLHGAGRGRRDARARRDGARGPGRGARHRRAATRAAGLFAVERRARRRCSPGARAPTTCNC